MMMNMNMERTDAGSGGGGATVERGGIVGVGVAGGDSLLETGHACEGRVGFGSVFCSDEFLCRRKGYD